MPTKSLFYQRKFYTRFLFFIGTIGVFTYPIIHANILFLDDNRRALGGAINAATDGRYFTEILMTVLNVGTECSDIGPLYQILSVIVLSIGLSLLSIALKFNNLSSYLILPLIICNPFYLQNLSFRFDSITMSLSLICGFLPFIVNQLPSYRSILSIIALLASLNFYQTGINCFLALVCMQTLLIIKQSSFERAASNFIRFVSYAAAALIIYKIEVICIQLSPVMHLDQHGSSLSQNNYHLFHILKQSSHGILKVIKLLIHGSGVDHLLLIYLLVGIITALLSILLDKKVTLKSTVFFCTVLLFSLLTLSGVMSILNTAPLFPRTLNSFGVICAIASTFIIGNNGNFKGWNRVKVPIVAFILFTNISTSFSYGSALYTEDVLNKNIANQLVEDLWNISKQQPLHVKILTPDQAILTPEVKILFNRRPILEKTAEFDDIWGTWIGTTILKGNSAPKFLIISSDRIDRDQGNYDPQFSLAQATKIMTTPSKTIQRLHYTLYQHGNKVVVGFVNQESSN